MPLIIIDRFGREGAHEERNEQEDEPKDIATEDDAISEDVDVEVIEELLEAVH